VVRDALTVPVSIALLKGRANYVCHYHLSRALDDGRFQSREEATHIRAIARFAKASRTGDKAECAEVPEDSGAWHAATSTRDNCLGQECPNHGECFVLAARREAMAADVVVVNHHLFFADVMLRDEGMAELLPACNAVIFDEAHQLPETASLFFGESVSTSQFLELARDTRVEAAAEARDCLPLPDATRSLEKVARDLRLSIRDENMRLAYAELDHNEDFNAALGALNAELAAFSALLETQAERSEGLGNCWRRATELVEKLDRWRTPPRADLVRWAEAHTQALSLNSTPLSVADVFAKQLEGHPRAWIFTSATLAVEKSFTHFCEQLGLASARTHLWGSPFDYPRQGLLFAPTRMPNPNDPGYIDAVVREAFPVIRASGGRAFVLCTSLRAMRLIHESLAQLIKAASLEMPLLMQGEGSRSELLSRFRYLGNAVLVASQSFWEGVDVPGEALTVVIIDKLPFAPPDDPVLSARVAYLRTQGKDAFLDYQLPRTVINMKQGAGRLIRTETDRGVLMICDPRLVDKPYGKKIWRSLPPMTRTRDRAVVEAFLAGEPMPAHRTAQPAPENGAGHETSLTPALPPQ
jgi:ATP-dependent DNA helicase DinG